MLFNLLDRALLLRRCFYQLVDRHFGPAPPEGHRTPLRDRLRHLRQQLIFIYSFRVVAMAWIALRGFDAWFEWYDFRRWDGALLYWYQSYRRETEANPTAHALRRHPFFFAVAFFLNTFDYYAHRQLYRVDRGRLVWRWWHQAVVHNQDQFHRARLPTGTVRTVVRLRVKCWERRIQKSAPNRPSDLLHLTSLLCHVLRWLPSSIQRPLVRLVARTDAWLRLDTVDRNTFFGRPLSILPTISRPLRTQFTLALIVADKVSYLLQLCAFFFTVFYLTNIFLYEVQALTTAELEHLHPLAFVWVLCEESVVLVVLCELGQVADFFLFSSLFGTLIYAGHLQQVYRLVWPMLKNCPRLSARHVPLFRYVFHEHTRVTYLVIEGSKRLFGPVLFAFIATNVPTNLYLVWRLFDVGSQRVLRNGSFQSGGGEDPISKLVVLSILLCQIAATALVFVPLAWCCQVYHRPHRFINRLQMATLRSRSDIWLKTKLKYDDLYGRLLHGPKLALTIGPLTPITYMTTLQFVAFYIGYLLMLFKRA